MTMKLSRRQFIKLTAGTIAAAGTYYLFWEQERPSVKPKKTFISLSRDFSSAADVAHSFVRANTPFLMASYSVFYPDLLLTRGRQAIQDLRKAATREKSVYKIDPHRLDALPAVAAAHLLHTTVMVEDKEALCKEIALTLNDERREVREIVVQNLISATSPNIDTLRFFTVNDDVLNKIELILLEAESNEKLLTPATLCAEFLLNARFLLLAKKAPKKDIEPYDRLLDLLKMSRADHFWFVSRLVQLHEATFSSPAEQVTLLLPQSSEALMGWKKFGYARDYLSHLALVRARLMYISLNTSNGKMPSDNIMNLNQAKRALPKTISFYRNFGLRDLINIEEALNNMPQSEQLFKRFLHTGEFDALIKHPEDSGLSMDDVKGDREEIELAKCVPFSQFREYGILDKMADLQDEDRRKFIWKVADNGFKAAVAGYGAAKGTGLLHDVTAYLFGLEDMKDSKIPENVNEEAVEEASKKDEAIDSGEYKGVDEQEKTLGKIDFPDRTDKGKHE